MLALLGFGWFAPAFDVRATETEGMEVEIGTVYPRLRISMVAACHDSSCDGGRSHTFDDSKFVGLEVMLVISPKGLSDPIEEFQLPYRVGDRLVPPISGRIRVAPPSEELQSQARELAKGRCNDFVVKQLFILQQP